MLLLDKISSLCTDPGLAGIILIIKRVVNIIWIIGPILAIISGVIICIKMMSNPEEKKYKNLFRNCVIALLMVLFIPVIVNAVMALFDEDFEVAACWNQAEAVSSNGNSSSYIDENGNKKPSNILPNPDDYKTGDKEKSS